MSMSTSQLNTDVMVFKLISAIQNSSADIIAQTPPFLIRKAALRDAKVLANLLTISFHSQDGWMQYFYPILRLGIYEDLRHRLKSHARPYACIVASISHRSDVSGDANEETKAGGQGSSEAIAPGGHQHSSIYQSSNKPESECGTDIVGTVELSVKQRGFSFSSCRYVYLANLAIHPDYRRRGVASQLLAGCEMLAQRWGFQDIYLHVLEDNVGARSLYQKLGYQVKQFDADLITWLLGHPRQLLLHKQLPQSEQSRDGESA